MIGFYQRVLSPARGDMHCPMHPSCSQYAAQAFDRLSWHEATIRTMDRLLRCGSDLDNYARVVVDGEPRWLDPLSPTALPPSALPPSALPPSALPPDSSFAAFLFARGEYDRAATEYLRLLFSATDAEQRAMLALRIGECSFAQGNFERCLEQQHRFADELRLFRPAREAMFLLAAQSASALGRWQEAVDILQWSGIAAGSAARREQLRLLGITFARMGKLDEAQEAWRTAMREEQDPVSASLLQGIPVLRDAPARSPLLAGVLSAILPGAGYAYAGRPATGLTALIINGLFAWATIDAVRGEQYGIAAAVGFFGLGWYVAGITGAASAAAAHGTDSRSARLDHLLERAGATQVGSRAP